MKTDWKSCLKIGITVFLIYLATVYWSSAANFAIAFLKASMPLIIGAVIAYVVNILMSFYEKIYFPKTKNKFVAKTRRAVSLTGAYVTFILALAAVVWIVIPQIASGVKLIFSEIPDLMEWLSDFVLKLNVVPEDIVQSLNNIDWESRIGEIVNIIISGIGNVTDIVVKTVSGVFTGVVTAFVAVIFSVYLLFDKDKLKAQMEKLFKKRFKKIHYDRAVYVLSVLNDCFRKYIIGQFTEAVILGVLCTVGMFALGLPYPTMIGALIGFTALIPIAGAYIGAAFGVFMIFPVSILQAMLFVVFIIILQQIEGNLIYPKVVGSTIGLPGIWVLAAITIGGSLAGIGGMLVGVPLASAMYRLLREYTYKEE